MVRTTNFEQNNFSDNLKFIDKNAYDHLKKSKVYPNDIIMNKIANAGACYIMPNINEKVSLGMNLFLIRLNTKKADPYYVFSYLKFNEHYVKSFASGSSTKTITKDDVRQLKIHLPTLDKQRSIAETLRTWDTAIEKTEALISAKERQFGWLRSELINKCQGEKFSLQALEEKGLIEMGRGNIISKKDILANPGDNPIYSSSVKNNGLFGCYGNFMFDEELITWSIDGGGNFFLRKKHKFSVTNVCGFMKVARKAINCGFLAAQLQERQSKLKFDYQFKAHPSVIRKIYNVVIPSIKEQKNIAEILDTAQQEITILKNLSTQYRTQKRGLMQKLLSGEWQLNPKEENHEKR
jgi:type I restriction enzyme S subunit